MKLQKKKYLNYKSPREDFLLAKLNLKFGKKEKRIKIVKSIDIFNILVSTTSRLEVIEGA